MGGRGRLWILTRKELSELSRERIVLIGLLVGPFLMYLIFGGLAAASAQSIAREASRPLKIVLAVKGEVDENVSRLAELLGAREVVPADRAYDATRDADAVIIINSTGLARLLGTGERLDSSIIIIAESPSIVTIGRYQAVEARLEKTLRVLLSERVRECLPRATPETLEKPAAVSVYFYHRGSLVPREAFMAGVFGSLVSIPMALLIVVLAAIQVAAVSLGIEKEARTLEKLLSMPVSFGDIIMGKILAISLLSLGGVASNVAGLAVYVAIIGRAASSASPTGEGFTVGAPMIGALDALVLVTGLAIALYVTILVGLLVGSASDDIRSSQLSASYVGFIMALPLFSVFFGLDLTRLSLTSRALLSLDPYFLLALLALSILRAGWAASLPYLAGLVLHGVVWSLLARRLLTPENILLGQPLLRGLAERARLKRARVGPLRSSGGP